MTDQQSNSIATSHHCLQQTKTAMINEWMSMAGNSNQPAIFSAYDNQPPHGQQSTYRNPPASASTYQPMFTQANQQVIYPAHSNQPSMIPAYNNQPHITPAFNNQPTITPACNNQPFISPAYNNQPHMTPAYTDHTSIAQAHVTQPITVPAYGNQTATAQAYGYQPAMTSEERHYNRRPSFTPSLDQQTASHCPDVSRASESREVSSHVGEPSQPQRKARFSVGHNSNHFRSRRNSIISLLGAQVCKLQLLGNEFIISYGDAKRLAGFRRSKRSFYKSPWVLLTHKLLYLFNFKLLK